MSNESMPNRGMPVTIGARRPKLSNKVEDIPQAKQSKIGRDGLVTQRNPRRDLHQDLRDA